MLALALIALAQVDAGPIDAGEALLEPVGDVPAQSAEQNPIVLTPQTAVDAPPAAATDAVSEPAAGFAHKVEINGYIASRTTYGRSRVHGLIPTADFPQWSELLELNVQLKVSYRPNSFVYDDVSGLGQAGFDYRTVDATGNEITAPDHHVPTLDPLFSVNEIYLLHEFAPWFNVMIGKKRLTWGAGQAYNPTDLLNVRKDPTDPTFQRAGAWLARIEVPLENSAFTLLFSPQVTESANGIPYDFV